MKKRLMSLALVFSMVLSMVPTVFATEDEPADETLKYVSLGDSMTNGYGLPGYDGNTGVEDYGNMSYANQFADYLGASKNHAQLAMSAMRVEDLHWLLEVDYEDEEVLAVIDTLSRGWDEELWNSTFTNGDYWTWHELVHDYRFDVAAYCIEGHDAGEKFNNGDAYAEYDDVKALKIVAEYYQNSVADGNVVSLGIGNGNFGVFMFGRIMEAIGFQGADPNKALIYNVERALAECEPEMQAELLALKDELFEIAEEYVAGYLADAEEENAEAAEQAALSAKALVNTAVYTCVSYALNYAGTVEAIVELNPDADVILMALMNTFAGAQDSEIEGITLGDLLTAVYTPLNAYIAGLPTVMQAAGKYEKADFFYAEADYVECMVEDYGAAIEDDPTGVIRNRFVESIVGNGSGMVWSLMNEALPESLALASIDEYDVAAYEEALASEHPESECPLGAACDYTAGAYHTVLALADAGLIALDGTTPTDISMALSCAIYLGFEKAIVAGSTAPVTLDSVLGLGSLTGEEETEDETENEDGGLFGGVMTALAPIMANPNLESLIILPNALSAALQESPALNGLLGLFGRCIIGNGLGGHPSEDGHNALTQAVVDAYIGNHTAKDETIENLLVLADKANDLAVESYREAYQYAVDNEYIANANNAIDELIVDFQNSAAWLEKAETDMTAAFKADVLADIEEIIDTLEAAKALINNADELDMETVNYLCALLEEAGEATWELILTLEQAGIDVNQLVIIPELKKAHAFLINEVIPQIDYQLQIAVKAGAEWLKEQAIELANELIEMLIAALPGVDAALYDWLYNNPDKVIAFFAEYGDDIVALTEEYGEGALGILAYIAFTYGDEVIEYVINNPEESLEMLVKWYDKYGYRIWPMVDVYLEELGVYEDIGAAFEALDQMMIALGGQVEDQIETIIEQMEAQLEILKGQLEDLNEQLMGAVGEIEQEILAAIEKIEAAIDAIEKAIEDLIEIVEDIKDTVESIMAAVEDVADVIEALKALDNSYINEILAALEETGLELMFNYMFLYTAYLDKCELGEDLDYVALGGATVANELYAETVAAAIDEAIGLPVTYTGAGSADLTYKTQMEYIMANAEAIADAELISYQQDANEIVDALLEVVLAVNLGGDYIAPDWSEYVDVKTIADVKANVETAKAELLPYLPAQIIDTIAEAEADITAKLTEQVDAETAEQLKPYVEQLVYSLVSYAVETAEAVEAIQTINENAPVLLVGMYNMLDGVVVKMNGTEIDLGEYFDYVIKAVDMYNVVYGVTTGDVTIVDVCEASVDEIVFDADELMGLYAEVEELMAGMNGIALDQIGTILEKIEAIEAKIFEALFTLDSILTNTANEDGIAYIAEQIAASLLVFDHIEEYEYDDEYHWLVCTYCGMVGESGKHEYDNSKDATCNVCDYERVIKKPASGGSSVGGSFFTNPFSDVNKSDYFYKAVMWAVQRGITAGIGDGQFGPHIDCTRAQVVTMLWRAAGSPRVTAENPFTDVSVNDYYYNAVLWAVKEGITAGTSATTFSPNQACSRAEIMTFVWKAIGAPAAKGANTFADVAADAYYATAVIWAAENGVTAGTGANTFSPEMICSRAQTVTFLWKVYGG